MASRAADLVDHVLPDAPLRQFVITLPFELRTRLAYDDELLGAVSRVFIDAVLGWYRRRMRDRGIKDGKSGAVTAVQRVSSDLRLNPPPAYSLPRWRVRPERRRRADVPPAALRAVSRSTSSVATTAADA